MSHCSVASERIAAGGRGVALPRRRGATGLPPLQRCCEGVGRKAHGLWIREGRIVHSSERTEVEANVITEGEQAFDEELAKLPEDERQQALDLAEEDTGEADAGAPDYIQELRELAKLPDEGILSEEEFQKKKEEILGLDEEDGGSR